MAIVSGPIVASKGSSAAEIGGGLLIAGERGVLSKMSFEEAEEAVFSELGASPQTPGIYRITAQSRRMKMRAMEMKKRGEPSRTNSPSASGPGSALGLLPSVALSSAQAD